MKKRPPVLDAGGLKGFRFALARDGAGQQLLVSNELVSAWQVVVAECLENDEPAPTFTDWMRSDAALPAATADA